MFISNSKRKEENRSKAEAIKNSNKAEASIQANNSKQTENLRQDLQLDPSLNFKTNKENVEIEEEEDDDDEQDGS